MDIQPHTVLHPTDANKHVTDPKGYIWYLDKKNSRYYGYVISHERRNYIDETSPDMQPLLTWLRENLKVPV